MPRIDEHGRPEPEPAAGELDTLVGFLEFQRATLEWKCAGLGEEGLRTTTAASTMTLAGLLKHMSFVEDHWFSKWLRGNEPCPPWDTVDFSVDPDWEWDTARHDSPDHLRDMWAGTVERSRVMLDEALAGRRCHQAFLSGRGEIDVLFGRLVALDLLLQAGDDRLAQIVRCDVQLGDLAQADHGIFVVVAFDQKRRTGRDLTRTLSGVEDEIEPIRNLGDAIFDGNAGHRQSFTLGHGNLMDRFI